MKKHQQVIVNIFKSQICENRCFAKNECKMQALLIFKRAITIAFRSLYRVGLSLVRSIKRNCKNVHCLWQIQKFFQPLQQIVNTKESCILAGCSSWERYRAHLINDDDDAIVNDQSHYTEAIYILFLHWFVICQFINVLTFYCNELPPKIHCDFKK